jgi:hypothetical protein
MMCDVMQPSEMIEWLDKNVVEVIHRDHFTTITINTGNRGQQSFRTIGRDSLYTAISKAKSYQIQNNMVNS